MRIRPPAGPRALLRLAAGAGLTILVLAAAGPPALDVTPPRPAAPAPAPEVALAARSATTVVAARPAFLHAGPNDAFVQHPVVSSSGLQYVPYDRTYRGLPVLGGDFVLVFRAGRLVDSSVAQQQTITGLSVTPALASGSAEGVAGRQLKAVSRVNGSRLVVDALDGAPRLAWESVVEGTGATSLSELSVYVDATTGAVLHTSDRLPAGTGFSGYNGPNPVPIATTYTGGRFTMTDPSCTTRC